LEKLKKYKTSLHLFPKSFCQFGRGGSSATAVMAAKGVSDSKRNAAGFSHLHEAISKPLNR